MSNKPVDNDMIVHEDVEKATKTYNSEDHQDDSSTDGNIHDDEEEKAEKVIIATTETKKVGYLRAVLILVLVSVAGCVSFAVYASSTYNETQVFEASATEACQKVVSTFQTTATRRLGVIDSLATSIASNAKAQGQTWPNVTVPDFEQRMDSIRELAAVMSITLLPVVTREDLEGWDAYSAEQNGWLNESLAFQGEPLLSSNGTINEHLYALGEAGTYYANSTIDEGPFLPWWQFAPVFDQSALVNYDTLTHPSRKYQLKAVLENQEPLVSEAFDYSLEDDPETIGKRNTLNNYLKHWKGGGKQYQYGPVSDLYYPVMDVTLPTMADQKPKLVAILTAYLYWQVYFEDILPKNTPAVVAVLENVCMQPHDDLQRRLQGDDGYQYHQKFTYVIRGEDAVYMGSGDLHDQKYDYLEETAATNAFSMTGTTTSDTPAALSEGQCLYSIRVYPTQEMEDHLRTNGPLYFMLVVLATFIVTSVIFLVYDHYVEKRQKVVMTKAVQSTQVVQSLFPENVRQRLFDESDGKDSDKQRSSPANSQDISGNTNRNMNAAMVADLYQNCTVLFADIAGFTAWSSNREPSHVFRLLETLYAAFDAAAKRRAVFKVETIGDCYLAITGVPNAQQDHAILMVKFAADCVEQMNNLVQSTLAEELGEDTAQLKLRVGIHSGPVTAGVIRSDRARFQIFGDTVNTASRLESNSLPGQIQSTAETAELLVAAGKGSWVTEREGGIEAKGKGRLASYWIQPKKRSSTTALSVTASSCISAESK